jgi:diaminopimelate decarboxylase
VDIEAGFDYVAGSLSVSRRCPQHGGGRQRPGKWDAMEDTPFSYRDGELHCEDVPAGAIAERYGTPCYVYSAASLTGRYERMRDAFARWEALVCFSVKSLANLSVLQLLAAAGSGFDVVSGGELHRVLAAGGDAGRVVFAGAGKRLDEIREALLAGIFMFNAESAAELEAIARCGAETGVRAKVAIRVNPDVDAQTHEKTTTGTAATKFGMGLNETAEAIRAWSGRPGLEVRGLHVHLGSPICSVEPYQAALDRMLPIVGRVRSAGCAVDHLNLGGGYCISYTGEEVIGPAAYAEGLAGHLERAGCAVIVEPGRYISGPSGLLLTRVVCRKENEYGKRFLVCDAGMNDLVRPTLYGAYQRIWPVSSPTGMPAVMRRDDEGYEGHDTEQVDVVGPVCETGDFLGKDRALPRVATGGLLAVFDCGAYCFTMSSNYNGRPRAAEVLVSGGESRLVRPRETYGDLVGAEKGLLLT